MTFTFGLLLGATIGGSLGAVIMAFFIGIGHANHHHENKGGY
jgi:hypothetical protein